MLQRVRDEWIARDKKDWLHAHGFYKDSLEALRTLAALNATDPSLKVSEGCMALKLLNHICL